MHPRVAEVREDSVNLESPVRSPYRSATRPVLQDHIDELDREVHNSFIRAERAKRPPHSPQEFRLAPVAAESVAHLPPLPVAIDKTTKPGIDANEFITKKTIKVASRIKFNIYTPSNEQKIIIPHRIASNF